MYALSKITQWLCGRAESTAEGEVESEKGGKGGKKWCFPQTQLCFSFGESCWFAGWGK